MQADDASQRWAPWPSWTGFVNHTTIRKEMLFCNTKYLVRVVAVLASGLAQVTTPLSFLFLLPLLFSG